MVELRKTMQAVGVRQTLCSTVPIAGGGWIT